MKMASVVLVRKASEKRVIDMEQLPVASKEPKLDYGNSRLLGGSSKIHSSKNNSAKRHS